MNKKEIKEKIIDNLLNIKDKKDIFDSMTTLQNEISVSFDTKVIAITAVTDDDLAASFAFSFAYSYSMNGFSALVIDANLYNQRLSNLLENKILVNGSDSIEFKDENKDRKVFSVDKNIDVLCLNNEIYPSIVFKEGTIQEHIRNKIDQYDHFIIIVPPLLHHKELLLLGDIVQSILLVAQKNVTLKKHIFETIQFLRINQMPLAKTVILK